MAVKILPKLVNITPKEMYFQLVRTTYDQIRATNEGLTYIPIQFGGIFGQNLIAQQSIVMELTDFKVD